MPEHADDLMAHPPTCVYEAQKTYVAFLSHYKVEAGITARYLRDLLQRMMMGRRQGLSRLRSSKHGGRIFLDSADLLDLRSLYDSVKASDAIVLLATEHVLTRPYCLLELWTAAQSNVPVVVLLIEGWRFTMRNAEKFLDEVCAAARRFNPYPHRRSDRQLCRQRLAYVCGSFLLISTAARCRPCRTAARGCTSTRAHASSSSLTSPRRSLPQAPPNCKRRCVRCSLLRPPSPSAALAPTIRSSHSAQRIAHERILLCRRWPHACPWPPPSSEHYPRSYHAGTG
jgi:hypothetical protein